MKHFILLYVRKQCKRNNQKDKSTAFVSIYEDRIKYFSERDEKSFF